MEHRPSQLLPILALALLAAAAGCSDNGTPPPVTPPGPSGSFVGYSDPANGLTTCGTCHIEKQAGWAATGHAHAWSDLQASGHAQAFCNSCHTTSGFGNAEADDTTGFFAVSDTASQKFYYDVQCESCHGSGGAHITGPETTQPIATIVADTGATAGCATCHSGEHDPFVEEWKASRHALAEDHMTSNTSCQPCHEGRRRLAMWDPDASYAEMTAGPAQATTCAVCHDPHGSENPAELRRSIDTKVLADNLCTSCHGYRMYPVVGSSRGNQPHGSQGGVMLGTAGWLPQGFTATGLTGSHAGSGNPDLCVGCHMEAYTATVGATTSYSVGHTFLATPCIDPATGLADSTQSCTSLTDRRFMSCVRSGCHTDEAAARAAFTAVAARVDYYVNTLWVDKDGDKAVDAAPTDGGLLAQIKAMNSNNVNPSDSTITVGDGAQFNCAMLGVGLADHPDGSRGTHNPFYAEALLIATINAVRTTYGLPAPPAEQRLFATRLAAIRAAR